MLIWNDTGTDWHRIHIWLVVGWGAWLPAGVAPFVLWGANLSAGGSRLTWDSLPGVASGWPGRGRAGRAVESFSPDLLAGQGALWSLYSHPNDQNLIKKCLNRCYQQLCRTWMKHETGWDSKTVFCFQSIPVSCFLALANRRPIIVSLAYRAICQLRKSEYVFWINNNRLYLYMQWFATLGPVLVGRC